MNAKPPAEEPGSGNPNALAQEAIDRIYEVAVDPTRYEELLDHWETMISPYRRKQGLDTPISLAAIDFEAHFRRASTVLDSIASGDPDDGSPADLVAQFDSSASFAIRADHSIIAANPPAQAAFGIRAGQPLSSLDLHTEDLSALTDQITRMLTANQQKPTLFRARLKGAPRLVIMQLRALSPAASDPFVVAVTSELIWPAEFDSFLETVFGLTKAETQVLRALSECHSVSDIATMRNRSIDTVRAQLKSLMAKTETRSQAELIRLTISTMDIATFTQDAAASAEPAQSKGFQSLEPRPYQSLTLPDGRRFDYLILGDPNGRPCFFGPQDYGLTRWPASAEAEAKRRGLRVIVPVRAGFGHSTALPAGSKLSEMITQDYAHLLDHLGVETCPFLSIGGDVFFSVHFQNRYPERVSAIIACAGILPLTRPEQYERMHKWHRFILAGARYTPHLLPFMVKAGFALARKLGKRRFVHAVYGDSPSDVATFENPEVFEAMVVGSEVSLSKDFTADAAFAAEVIEQERTDWSGAVAQVQGVCPLVFINGMQDPQTPPETLAEFQQDYPWIRFETYEKAGQLIFFLKWKETLDILEEFY